MNKEQIIKNRLVVGSLLISLLLQNCDNSSALLVREISRDNTDEIEWIRTNKKGLQGISEKDETKQEVVEEKNWDKVNVKNRLHEVYEGEVKRRKRHWTSWSTPTPYMLSIPLLASCKKGGSVKRNLASAESALLLRGSSPFIAACSTNVRSSCAPRLTTDRLIGSRIIEKQQGWGHYNKNLLSNVREKEKRAIMRVSNYSRFSNSYSNPVPVQKSLPYSRAYTTSTNPRATSEEVVKKSSLLKKVGVAGGILGTVAYTIHSTNSTHAENKENLTTDNNNPEPQAYNATEGTNKLLPDYRPDDWAHLHYAVQAYDDEGGKVLGEGWECIKKSPVGASNSYFGAAYRNVDKKHIIIAHRGTEDLKDWLEDFNAIASHLSDQEASAWNFAESIIKAKENGSTYSYSFTGHSLGGWLALICLHKYKDVFINDDKNVGYQDGFAVTFDDPGVNELCKALQPRVAGDYRVDINKLDITSYLSRPHTINTAMGHVGTVYAIHPDITNLSLLQKNTLLYTKEMHDKKRFVDSFSPLTGRPVACVYVIDWPRVQWGNRSGGAGQTKGWMDISWIALKNLFMGQIDRSEYVEFYKLTPYHGKDQEQLPTDIQFRLQHGVHYRIKPFDEQLLPLRNMPEVVRRFLVELAEYSNDKRVAIITSLITNPIDQKLRILLEHYTITPHQELSMTGSPIPTTAFAFRDRIIKFLQYNPSLAQSKLSVLLLQKSLQDIKTNDSTDVVRRLDSQSEHTTKCISQLSIKQSTANLYRFVKPTREEYKEIEDELKAINVQLEELKEFEVSEKQPTSQILEKLQLEAQKLELAKQITSALLKYMEGELDEADEELNVLASNLKKSTLNLPNLGKELLLNRAYNLLAKIAARKYDRDTAQRYYKQAIEILPEDAITWSNYGGLLVDRGYEEENPDFYIKAYDCYEKFLTHFQKQGITTGQAPIIWSGMALGYIMLAKSIEEGKKYDKPLDVKILREDAKNFLHYAIKINPKYANARVFLALLYYDQKRYEDALKEIDNLLGIIPLHATGLMHKGFILDQLGKKVEALESLKQARKGLEKDRVTNKYYLEKVDEKISDLEKINEENTKIETKQ